MQPDEPDLSNAHLVPSEGDRRLRLVVSNPLPQRRRTPRRQLVVDVDVERRASDRRRRSLGVDGLLRTILADRWTLN